MTLPSLFKHTPESRKEQSRKKKEAHKLRKELGLPWYGCRKGSRLPSPLDGKEILLCDLKHKGYTYNDIARIFNLSLNHVYTFFKKKGLVPRESPLTLEQMFKAQGKRLGRPPALSQEQKQRVHQKLQKGDSVSSIAKHVNVSRQTITRLRDAHLKPLRS